MIIIKKKIIYNKTNQNKNLIKTIDQQRLKLEKNQKILLMIVTTKLKKFKAPKIPRF